MKRPLITALSSSLLVMGLAPAGATTIAPALGAASQPIPGVSVTTDNVTHVGYIPDVGPTVSARVVQVGEQKRLYVSSIGRGLTIYDVTQPEAPELIGALPLGGWQNEDMAVSDDGKVTVLAYGDENNYEFNLVIDTSDPTLPEVASRTSGGDHTAECVTPSCSYLYGSEGNIYDLRNLSSPVTVGSWITMARQQGVPIAGFPHKVVRDASGYVITDSSPRAMFDVTDPVNPVVVSRNKNAPPSASIQYQHNNLRPRAEDWVPREEDDLDPALKPGELMLANGETNAVPQCNGTGGPFMTWSMANWDRYRDTAGAEGQFQLIKTFRPLENGNYMDGNPAVNALGCSGHWFDWTTSRNSQDTYVVAAAWFEHGVRFLEVDAKTGDIKEVGFFQPFNGSTGATYWIDDEYVYTTDYVRGIDILRFDHDPLTEPSQDELDANWIAGLELPTLPATAIEQYVCRFSRTTLTTG